MKHKILLPFLLLSAGVFFFSCEMKKELTGQIEKPGTDTTIPLETAGLLDLHLKPEKEPDIPVSKGDISGSEVVVLDVNDFAVDILDENGEVVRHYNSYADLKNEGGLLLPAGTYRVRATLGDEVNAGFDQPFYSGTTECEITPQEVAKVITDCVLANKKLVFHCSDEFLAKFNDDYSIVIDNGSGALTTYKEETRTAFFKNTGTLRFTVYATNRQTHKPLLYHCNLSGNGQVQEYNNILVDLNIVNEQPDNPDEPDEPAEPDDPGDPEPDPKPDGAARNPIIKVDISLIEKDYVIEVPSSFIETEDPGTDDPGTDDPDDDQGGKPSVAGDGFNIDEPKVVSIASPDVAVRIKINTPKILASLQISIQSEVLEPLLDQIGLGRSFDMCNLTDKQESVLTDLGLPIPQQGESAMFDISSFMPMIAILDSPGDYKFTVKAVDKAGQSAVKTLTIRMTK